MSSYYKRKPSQQEMRIEMKDLQEKSKALFLTTEESERLSYLFGIFGVKHQQWERIDLGDSYHPIAASSLKELELKHQMAVRSREKRIPEIKKKKKKKEPQGKKLTMKEKAALDAQLAGQQSMF